MRPSNINVPHELGTTIFQHANIEIMANINDFWYTSNFSKVKGIFLTLTQFSIFYSQFSKIKKSLKIENSKLNALAFEEKSLV